METERSGWNWLGEIEKRLKKKKNWWYCCSCLFLSSPFPFACAFACDSAWLPALAIPLF